MKRVILITEEFGFYQATDHTGAKTGDGTLEGLLAKLDPGVDQPNLAMAAGIIEHALGPKREGDHGQIQQGVVGT